MIEEWREYSKLLNTYLGPLPSADRRRTAACTRRSTRPSPSTGRLSTTNPNLQAIPIRTELGREIRSRVRRRAGPQAALGRLLAGRAAHPRARLRRAEAARGVRARRGHPRRDRRRGARQGPGDADEGRAQRSRRWSTSGSSTASRRSGSRRTSRSRASEAQEYIDAYLARFPHVQDFIAADDRAGRARRLRDDAARPAPARAGDPRLEPRRRARSASGSPSTRHAGHGRGHHQGGDGARSTAGCATRAAARGSSSRCTTSSCSRCPSAEVTAVRELVREEMCGAYPLDPPLAVDVGAGDDWDEAKS